MHHVSKLASLLLVGVLTLGGCSILGGNGGPVESSLSPEEAMAAVEQENERLLAELHVSYPDASVPTVSQVALVSLKEWPHVMSKCLNEEGFETNVVDEGVGGTLTDAQKEPYAVAMYACNIKYPMDPRYTVPFSDAQLNYLYDYYTGDLTDCLTAEGITVEEPPSRQKFLETYSAGSWTPYASATGVSDWLALNEQCPQNPEGLFG
ncbi:MAG: hypothetical protein ACSHW9_02475 [Salinibacterium amurskyense]